MTISTAERFRGALLGLAVGDALGTTLEFTQPGSFTPVTDMSGGGPFRLKPGQWTDDTSMALCLATSLVTTGRFDAGDQMARYVRWQDEGYLSSTGECFDIGMTVRAALDRFRHTGDPFAGPTLPNTAGNGCIMRLAPIPMFFFGDLAAIRSYAAESSRTTHGAPECLQACRLFAGMLHRALEGRDKDEVLLGDAASFEGSAPLVAIAKGAFREKPRASLRPTGYVVGCLEAALWCFATTETFKQAVLQAANLGGDADTTAAVCGQLAGAFYGVEAIPETWKAMTSMGPEILSLADQLLEGRRGTASAPPHHY